MNPYHDYPDNIIIEMLLSGDDKAFEQIYFRYAKPLYRYALKRISNNEDCEEIIQEIFESLWTRHTGLSHVTNIEAYLYRMVKYKVIRYFQHNKVKEKYAVHFMIFEELVEELYQETEIQTLRSLINNSIGKLPERCQMVVRLRIDENLSNSDIAVRMNIDKATVKRYMTTALSYFRERHSLLYSSK